MNPSHRPARRRPKRRNRPPSFPLPRRPRVNSPQPANPRPRLKPNSSRLQNRRRLRPNRASSQPRPTIRPPKQVPNIRPPNPLPPKARARPRSRVAAPRSLEGRDAGRAEAFGRRAARVAALGHGRGRRGGGDGSSSAGRGWRIHDHRLPGRRGRIRQRRLRRLRHARHALAASLQPLGAGPARAGHGQRRAERSGRSRRAVGLRPQRAAGDRVLAVALVGSRPAPGLPLRPAGVRGAAGRVRGDDQERGCDYSQRIPCPNGPGRVEKVDTQHLPEGSQPLYVSAQDAAGNSANSATVTARIDNTPPGVTSVGVEGGEAWRNRNDFDVAWENAPEPDRAPITVAHYRVCRVGSGECVSDSRGGASIARLDNVTVPAPGEWELRLWREDAAGNQQPENASLPVRLRFDPEPPKLGFEVPSAADPTRVSVQVTDPISGLGGGEIEISRVGSGVWQALPTSQENSHLVSRVDDAALPAGEYELRATAQDQAGNLASTSRRLDGQPMKVKLPLRVASSLRAGAIGKKRVRSTVHHGGKSHKVTRTITVLKPREKVGFDRHVRFAGVLVDRAGSPVTAAPVQVYSTPPEGEEALVGTLTTGAHGHFAYAIDARASQTLRFAYPATSTRLPAEDKVALLVSARSTFSVNRSRILNGQSVVFSGRVQGRPLPAAGKLIQLQVWLSDEWSTFRTIHSKPDGRWRIPYRFQRTCGLEHFRFRPRLPGEASYPLEAGHGPVLALTVKGQPCSTG